MRTAILVVLVEQNQSCDWRKEQPKKEPQPSISFCGLRPVGAKESKQVENQSFRCVVHALLPALFKWRITVRKGCGLTVKLRGRTEAPGRGAEGAQFLSARGAKPQAHHGPLQRLSDRNQTICNFSGYGRDAFRTSTEISTLTSSLSFPIKASRPNSVLLIVTMASAPHDGIFKSGCSRQET